MITRKKNIYSDVNLGMMPSIEYILPLLLYRYLVSAYVGDYTLFMTDHAISWATKVIQFYLTLKTKNTFLRHKIIVCF